MNRTTFLTLLTSALLLLGGCERPKGKETEPSAAGPVPVTPLEIRTATFPAVLEATGRTEAFNTVQVYTRVNGYLAKRHYAEGSYVTRGTTLFTIDPSDFNNALESARAAHELALANHANARSVLERIKPLAEANAASRQELDTATANERHAAAAVSAARAALEQAKLNLSYTTITAPISGYVDRRRVDEGTYVTAGANGLLTTMYQNDPIYVHFTFSENEKLSRQNAIASGRLSPPKNGQYDVELILGDGSTLSRSGRIDFVSPFVDPATGNVMYRAVLDNRDGTLLPGQFVRVRVRGMEWKEMLHLPQNAILTGDKGTFVYVIEANNTVSHRAVTTGAWIGENVLIERGIETGETVAIDSLNKLRPGTEVIPDRQ